jgi:hypothetical protein
VQLVNGDLVQAQPLETALNGFANVRWTCIVGPLIRARTVPTHFGRNHQVIGVGKQRFGNQFLVDLRPIGIRSVDEIHTQLDGAAENGQGSLPIFRRAKDALAREPHRSVAETVN